MNLAPYTEVSENTNQILIPGKGSQKDKLISSFTSRVIARGLGLSHEETMFQNKKYIVFYKTASKNFNVASAIYIDRFGAQDLVVEVRHFIYAPAEQMKKVLTGFGKFTLGLFGGAILGGLGGSVRKTDSLAWSGLGDIFSSAKKPKLPPDLPSDISFTIQAIVASLEEAVREL